MTTLKVCLKQNTNSCVLIDAFRAWSLCENKYYFQKFVHQDQVAANDIRRAHIDSYLHELKKFLKQN